MSAIRILTPLALLVLLALVLVAVINGVIAVHFVKWQQESTRILDEEKEDELWLDVEVAYLAVLGSHGDSPNKYRRECGTTKISVIGGPQTTNQTAVSSTVHDRHLHWEE